MKSCNIFEDLHVCMDIEPHTQLHTVKLKKRYLRNYQVRCGDRHRKHKMKLRCEAWMAYICTS